MKNTGTVQKTTAAMAHCHMRRFAISAGRPGGLITEITWIAGNLEVICGWCFIVVWCNKWEFRAMGFDRISHNPILCMIGGWCNEDSNLR